MSEVNTKYKYIKIIYNRKETFIANLFMIPSDPTMYFQQRMKYMLYILSEQNIWSGCNLQNERSIQQFGFEIKKNMSDQQHK